MYDIRNISASIVALRDLRPARRVERGELRPDFAQIGLEVPCIRVRGAEDAAARLERGQEERLGFVQAGARGVVGE